MNRKLHNTLMALSSTGLLLVVGLMIAAPVPQGREPSAGALAQSGHAAATAREARAEAQSRRMAARVEAFELQLAAASDTGEAIGATAAFVAEVAIAAALREAASADRAPATSRQATTDRATGKRGDARRAIALPYFSFARGSRGGNRG